VKQHELEEMEEHKGGIPSKNILFMNSKYCSCNSSLWLGQSILSGDI